MQAQSKHVRNYMVPTGGKVGYNNVKIFINGEDAWTHVHQSILGAKKSIHLCFWMLDSNLELTRNLSSSLLDPPMRKHNTLIEILKKKVEEGVKVRILLWNHIGQSAKTYFLDPAFRQAAETGLFEVIYQSHPETHGSWHQKTITIDDSMAYVGGMNGKENDWDTSDHLVLDIRRMKHTSSGHERKAVNHKKDYEALFPPRRDYMTCITGPAVVDVLNNFTKRWNYSITQKFDFWQHASKSLPPYPVYKTCRVE